MPALRPHILFAEDFNATAIERMRSVGRVTVLEPRKRRALYEAVSDCDALLVRSGVHVTEQLMEHAHRLRVIGRGGVGLENIDLDAARRRGIVVVYTPGAATDAVADLALGLMVALVRKLKSGDASVREARFYEAREQAYSFELRALTLGIIGMGRIGRAVAQRCRHGFGMSVLYNDIVRPGLLDVAATPATKDELYQRADIVTLHVPLTDDTQHLIDAAALARFKSGSLLINTARGAVVDSRALAHALSSGALGGAGLDVFEPEPLPADHPLMHAPNTLFTPHIGARTHDGLSRMNAVVDDVISVLRGEPPRYPAWK